MVKLESIWLDSDDDLIINSYTNWTFLMNDLNVLAKHLLLGTYGPRLKLSLKEYLATEGLMNW